MVWYDELLCWKITSRIILVELHFELFAFWCQRSFQFHILTAHDCGLWTIGFPCTQTSLNQENCFKFVVTLIKDPSQSTSQIHEAVKTCLSETNEWNKKINMTQLVTSLVNKATRVKINRLMSNQNSLENVFLIDDTHGSCFH